MPKILYTSLDEIKSFSPCVDGWKDILKGQNKTASDSVLFPLIDCLESNSISDVCWLLGKRQTELEILVRFAHLCADSVKHRKVDYAAEAANHAADAAANYAADAADYAAAAANHAAYANHAAAAAYAAAAVADYAYDAAAAYAAVAVAAAYDAAYKKQEQLNKQFFIQAIQEWEANH